MGLRSPRLGRSIAIDPDGNVYVVGYAWRSFTSSYDALSLSYTSDGSLRFIQWYYTGLDDCLTGIATSPNGHVYAIGHSVYPAEDTYYYRIIVLNISKTDAVLTGDDT